MKRFVLSPAAAADIEQIEAFLDAHAPHATDRVLDALRNAMRRPSRAVRQVGENSESVSYLEQHPPQFPSRPGCVLKLSDRQ